MVWSRYPSHIHPSRLHRFSYRYRVRLARIDRALLDRLGHRRGRHAALIGQRFERGHGDVVAIDFEVFAQLPPVIGAAETVGAEYHVRLVDERPDLIGEDLHVIGRGNDRAGRVIQALAHVGFARTLLGVQQVPALHVETLAAQFVEAGRAPHVGGYAEVLFQQVLRGDDFAQNRAAAEQLHSWGVLFPSALCPLPSPLAQLIYPLENTVFGTLRHRRVCVILVEQSDVEEDVLLLLDHAAQSILDDHGDFVREGRVVGNAVRDGRRQNMAVAVLVLQALAVQRGAAGSPAQQKAARTLVASRPGQVADALEAEHRVVD